MELEILYRVCRTLFSVILIHPQSSVIDAASSYGLDDRGVGIRVPVESRIFPSLSRPDRHLGPPSLLSNGYRGLSPRGKAAGA
jgi:hypothetical protein